MTVASIAIAILLSAPFLSHATATSYAAVIDRAARRDHVPALLVVAVVENESRWYAGATNGSGTDEVVGLGQIKLGSEPACRKDVASPECQAARAALMDPATNLDRITRMLRLNQKHCGKRPERYLAGYQGIPGCKPHKLTWRVLRRWQALERAVRHPRARGFHTSGPGSVGLTRAGDGHRRPVPGRVQRRRPAGRSVVRRRESGQR